MPQAHFRGIMRFKITMFCCLILWLLLSNAALAENEKLVFAVDVIRHGDRSPIYELPGGAEPWPQGLGQLTAEGMAQEFKLGTRLQDEYITKTHLLPETYQADSIYVRSSDVDRTLMSAQCVLLGLYCGKGPSSAGQPVLPGAYQPIPIHTIPFDEDQMLVVDFNPKFETAVKPVHSSHEFEEQLTKMRPHFARWSELAGVNVTDLRQLSNLADIIRIRQFHHIAQPKGMTEADTQAIIEAGDWSFVHSYRPPEIGRVGAALIVRAIADYFEQVKQAKTHLKLALFSSHDTTIASIMSALGVPLDQRPPYASDLNLSLYEEGKSFKVKIKFNGQPISLPGTTGGSCPLEQFLQIINKGAR
jgi:acid phosphatase